MTFIEELRAAEAKHGAEACKAYELFTDYCGRIMPRVPGMDTVLRLAYRISLGSTIEQAAAKEYLYRWNLALQSPIFGVPHSIEQGAAS